MGSYLATAKVSLVSCILNTLASNPLLASVNFVPNIFKLTVDLLLSE